ncbi:SNF2 family N-terminal domain-containing protein [Tribonema minus]|uniref:SNF2 family N-terminal domain-containing protein n=1 Tax=Tribonema minus TaxID=303371 RepID=A0A835ZHK9_9STRA|nr:SNF2 family N-terminal domain-containing protein [Tribonema minus]
MSCHMNATEAAKNLHLDNEFRTGGVTIQLTHEHGPTSSSSSAEPPKQTASKTVTKRPAMLPLKRKALGAVNLQRSSSAQLPSAATADSDDCGGAGMHMSAAPPMLAETPATASAGGAAGPDSGGDMVLDVVGGREVKLGVTLSKHLKPHQREGILFLWRCLAGAGAEERRGAILADEMGLGKTLTTIALVSGLLRHCSAVKKVVVTCPSSLVNNWAAEVRRWCGNSLMSRSVVVNKGGAAAAQQAVDFRMESEQRYALLIISHDLLCVHTSTWSFQMFLTVKANNLIRCELQYYVCHAPGQRLSHVVRPALRPAHHQLRPLFRAYLTNFQCCLLPTSVVLDVLVFHVHALPQAEDFRMGSDQRYALLIISYDLFRAHAKTINAARGLGLLICDEGHRLKSSNGTKTMKALEACPAAMRLMITGTPVQNNLEEFYALANFVYPGVLGDAREFRSMYARPIEGGRDTGANRAMVTLAEQRTRQLSQIMGRFVLRRTKGVAASSLTPKTELTVFCTPTEQQRQLYRNCLAAAGFDSLLRFNGQPLAYEAAMEGGMDAAAARQPFLFLLSAKAGGCGLNLVGGNRLVLYDQDWNPATCQQTMARVWRFGQTKPVFIYRLITTGTLEEVIYQRQMLKGELSSVVDGGGKAGEKGGGGRGRGTQQFSLEELRDLFALREDSASDTRDKLLRGGGAHASWRKPYAGPLDIPDAPLSSAATAVNGTDAAVTFVHATCTTDAPPPDDDAQRLSDGFRGAGEERAGNGAGECSSDDDDDFL